MLQNSSQNDALSAKRLKIWLDWLAENYSHVQDTSDIVLDKEQIAVEMPSSVEEMLRCIVSMPAIMGPANPGQEKLKRCLETLHNNQDEVVGFFQVLQNKPSIIISVMQKLASPLPLPLKDLIRAIEEAADDTTSASADLRQALTVYLDTIKRQQDKFVALMQHSAKVVVERSKNQSDGEKMNSFVDEWVHEFESRFVQLAKQDEYSKDLGELINASVRVLKEQKSYRAHHVRAEGE